MKTAALVSACLSAGTMGVIGCGAPSDTSEPTQQDDIDTSEELLVGDHLTGIADADFSTAKAAFVNVEDVNDGLGPIFNDAACGNCHNLGAVGGAGTATERRFGRFDNGIFNPLANEGGSLRQLKTLGNFTNASGQACSVPLEQEPADATVHNVGRLTTPLFGLGLVDATPDSTFWAVAHEEKSHPDGIAGLVSVVTNLSTGQDAVGKFGWKGQVPTLFQFSGDAYLNEMGVTSPQFPDENCPGGDCDSLSCNPMPGLNDEGDGVEAFTDFMTFLAPPPRGQVTSSAVAGELVFRGLGCAGCHRPTLRTGPNAVAALNKVYYQPYSDFLLHDMGALGDGVTQNQATGTLMRTAPLWGLRKITRYLHDGRAQTYAEAILAHDGQGKKARDRFAALPGWKKSLLYAFLGSL